MSAGRDSGAADHLVEASDLPGNLRGEAVPQNRLTPRRAVGYYALCETAIALFALASPWFFP